MTQDNTYLRDHGYLYDATTEDPKLTKERAQVKDLCFEYNYQVRPSETDKQQEILSKILGYKGKNISVMSPFWVDYGYNVEFGDYSFANHNLVILDTAKVRIGKHVFIAANVHITTAGHPLDPEMRNSGLEYAYPVTIGDNVWIGSNVVILPGVTIGSNVVIGAGSIVTRDIPDGVVAVGNPCRVLRALTAEDKKKYQTPPACCQRD